VTSKNRRVVFLAVILIFGSGIILPALFGEPRGPDGRGGDHWRNTIYDFQTLFTGLAAVVAAAYTVRTMEETERRSEKRHNELMSLQLRADRLKIERALNPQLYELIKIQKALQDIKSQAQVDRPGDPLYHWLSYVAAEWLWTFKAVGEVLERQQLRDAVLLFDGATTRYLDELSGNSGIAVRALEAHITNSNRYGDEAAYYEAEFEEFGENWRDAILWSIQCLKQLNIHLQRMAALYGADVL
jgi:hypothetical protein